MLDLINAILFPAMWGPVTWEIHDDWNKDVNKKKDVTVRACLMLFVATAYAFVHLIFRDIHFVEYFFRGLSMTFACFLLVFNYAMAARFAPDRDWFSYLSNSRVDNLERKYFSPFWRFVIRLIVMSLASVWYW